MWIISDLHLSDNFSFIEKASIIKMLLHIKKCGKTTLVFNGDVFDFARVTSIPSGYKATKWEMKYGLYHSVENAVEKMNIIIESQKEIFDLLRELLLDGFVLVFLLGNHDSELRFDVVQRVIQNRLGAAIGNNLFFDMRYIADGVLIEHGHQYDPENRIAYIADDIYAEEYTFGYVTTRYFGNILEKKRRLPLNDLSAGEYFLWVFRNFGFGAIKYIFQYFIFVFKVMARSGVFYRYRDQTNSERLEAKPLMASLVDVVKRLYLFQVLLFIGCLGTFIFSIICYSDFTPYSLIALGISIVPLFTISSRKRLFYILRSVSKRLRILYKVNIVIFGHNHQNQMDGREMHFYSSVPIFDKGALNILKVENGDVLIERIL